MKHTTTQLIAAKIQIRMVPRDGHMHLTVKNGTRRFQCLTSLKAELTEFEKKAALLYFFQRELNTNASYGPEYVNYAEIFGSIFEREGK